MAQSKVAERLMAHAQLCRKLADASLDESVGANLLRMAEECLQAATAGGKPVSELRAVAIHVPVRNSRFETKD